MGTTTGPSPSSISANKVASQGGYSWGERILPCLLAAMEACWLDALLIGIASIHLFQLMTPFMPLWAPFVLMIGSCALALSVEGSPGTRKSGQPVMIVALLALAIALLVVLWSSAYTQVASLFDPSWLLTALNDLLFLNARFYQVLAALALSVYICWRGIHISRRILEPGHIFRALLLGLGIILLVILIRMGAGAAFYEESALLLLLLIFLSLTLGAHALARAIYLRRTYVAGLQGSIATQERTLLTSMIFICACLLGIGLLLGTLTSPAILSQIVQALAPLGVAYDWVTTLLAHVVIFVLTPVVWLLSLLNLHPRWTTTTTTRIKTQQGQGQEQSISQPDPGVLLFFSVLLKIVLPLVCIGILLLLIRLAMKRRRTIILRRDGDLHESVWSWTLFLSQLRALLLALWQRFFPAPALSTAAGPLPAAIEGAPTVRDIRAIYRALLAWAASRGHARRKEETPYEFEARLDQKMPTIETQLQEVTEVYTATRYGEIVPDEMEVTRVQQVWSEIQQNTMSDKRNI